VHFVTKTWQPIDEKTGQIIDFDLDTIDMEGWKDK